MLKALGGGRKWRVFKRGRKEEIQNDDGETKKKDRVNGRAEKMDVYLDCVSPLQ